MILIGYMGCGKTSVGRQLALRLKGRFLDTDAGIEKQQGCTIAHIFDTKGEAFFRNLETELLKEMVKQKEKDSEWGETDNGCVISAGGGLPLKDENRELLHRLGTVIYLKAKPETIYERIKGDTTRPLLRAEDPKERITKMMREREEKYQAAAQRIVAVDGKTVEEIVEEILYENI